MSNDDNKKLIQRRKDLVKHQIQAFKTALHIDVTVVTTKFSGASKGYDVHVAHKNVLNFTEYLDREAIQYEVLDGDKFTIMYPEDYCLHYVVGIRSTEETLMKQKEIVMRALRNAKFKPKMGAAKTGSFGVNQKNSIVSRKTIEITVKKEATAPQIQGVIQKVYANNKLVQVLRNGLVISIKFLDEFFKPQEVSVVVQEPSHVAVVEEKKIEKNLALEDLTTAMKKVRGTIKALLAVCEAEIHEMLYALLTTDDLVIFKKQIVDKAGDSTTNLLQYSKADILELIIKPLVLSLIKEEE